MIMVLVMFAKLKKFMLYVQNYKSKYAYNDEFIVFDGVTLAFCEKRKYNGYMKRFSKRGGIAFERDYY